ncbi:MAG: DedA family protein [Devosia sp.]
MESQISQFVVQHGYLGLALVVGLESMGIPLPGETVLIATSILAGTTHSLNVWWIVVAATVGAIVGDNIGFWIGRRLGYGLVLRYGRVLHLTERRIKVGRYLFSRWGGWVVFLGRFVAVLRAWAALLAGINHMRWWRFFLFNAAGCVMWASIYGLAAYYLGTAVSDATRPIAIALGVVAVLAIGSGLLLFRHLEQSLGQHAEAAYPGPLVLK